MKRMLLLLWLLGSSQTLFTQNEIYGARAFALSCASVSEDDPWALFNNPSFSSSSREISCMISYRNLYLLKETSMFSLGALFPFANSDAFGIRFSKKGFGDYREFNVGFVYSKQIMNCFAAALHFYFLSNSFSDKYYGRNNGIAFDLSTEFKPSEKLIIGLLINNPACLNYISNNKNKERIFSGIRLGFRYKWSEDFFSYGEFSKFLKFPLDCGMGLEIIFNKKTYIRMSVSAPDFRISTGIGIRCVKSFSYDLSCAYHVFMGTSLVFSMQKNINMK